MMTRSLPKPALAAALLALFAFSMSALISRTVFDRMPHLEDEMAYLFQARTYAGGHLTVATPQPQRAYWQPFLIDREGPRFGKYTPGWSMQLALGVLMGQLWIINAFYAALTVALVYRLGREIFNPDVGVVAAALTAFSPMALLLSGTLMGHTSALFAATLFLYAYCRIERGGDTLRWGVLAGIGLGLLLATRPLTAVAVATPLILWSGLRLIRALARALWRWRTRAERAETELRAAAWSEPLAQKGEISSSTLAVMTMEVELRAPPRPAPAFAPREQTPIHGFFKTLAPLILLSILALGIGASVPFYNNAAVDDPAKDLYTLVWKYDRVGFGAAEDYGRSGHTLEKGIRQARFDLSLTAADLFGWETGTLTQPDGTVRPEIQNHLLTKASYWLQTGLSWLLLPFAALVAYRRKVIFVGIWLAAGCGWVWFALNFQGGAQLTNHYFAWLWIATALAWLYLPLLFWRDRMRAWTWLLFSVAVGLVIIQMTYWIGSQLYSTRYFFEGLTSIAIISALPVAWLARRVSRPLVYALLALALAYSFYFYSTPRISVLKGFNLMTPKTLDGVQARRDGDQPVLVIVNGSDVRWRALGPLMAVTSPYLDSDIIGAWNYEGSEGSVKQQILDRFPDRQVIEMNAQGNYAWFADEAPPPEVASAG